MSITSLALAAAVALPPAAAAENAGVRWETRPFLQPVVGASVYSSGDQTWTAAALGAQAGIRFWQVKPDPFWMGTARVRGEYLVGSGVQGQEVRVGTFAGPWWKFVGAQTGPDLFWNRYTYGDIELDPVQGLAWPLMGLVDVDVIDLYAGLEPSFFLASDRPHVDWSEQDGFGFGHEFAWFAGAGLTVKGTRIAVTWTRRTTAFGKQEGFGLGFKVGG